MIIYKKTLTIMRNDRSSYSTLRYYLQLNYYIHLFLIINLIYASVVLTSVTYFVVLVMWCRGKKQKKPSMDN